MKKVLIASIDAYTKEIIKSCVKQAFPKTEIIDVTIDNDVLYHVKSADDGIILFDKYFLSYVLKFKILSLRNLNRRLRIIFCEAGDCSRFFGLRVYDLNADGFVCNIQDKKEFVNKLRIIFSGKKLFPEEVMDSLNSNEHLRFRKYCSEVTEMELEIGMYLGEGKSIKQISGLVEATEGAVGIHISRLKKKIGFESMNDFCVLNRQLEKLNLRSWSC